jgi:signal peptidase I
MSYQLSEPKSALAEIVEWIRFFLAAFLVALLLQTFVVTLAHVDGESMLNSLWTNDVILVNRINYTFFTPNRGDVVMCKYPNDDSNRNYVKRLIGLPGETIECRDKIIYINGNPLDEPYITLDNSYDFDRIQLLDSEYFVMGDNRMNSHDSRAVGPLNKQQFIIGNAIAVIWPLTHARSFS